MAKHDEINELCLDLYFHFERFAGIHKALSKRNNRLVILKQKSRITETKTWAKTFFKSR